MKMEKKSERLEIRLGYQEKASFVDACEIQGDTPSGAVRRFISGYIRRSDRDVLKSAWRASGRRRLGRPLVIIVSMFALVVLGVSLYSHLTRMDKGDIFAQQDVNADGVLIGEEIGSPVANLLAVLDVDSSGGVSLEEFQVKGQMALVLSGPESNLKTRYKLRNEEMVKIISFDYGPELLKSGTSMSDKKDIRRVERIVFLHKGETKTVFNGLYHVDMSGELDAYIQP